MTDASRAEARRAARLMGASCLALSALAPLAAVLVAAGARPARAEPAIELTVLFFTGMAAMLVAPYLRERIAYGATVTLGAVREGAADEAALRAAAVGFLRSLTVAVLVGGSGGAAAVVLGFAGTLLSGSMAPVLTGLGVGAVYWFLMWPRAGLWSRWTRGVDLGAEVRA